MPEAAEGHGGHEIRHVHTARRVVFLNEQSRDEVSRQGEEAHHADAARIDGPALASAHR